MTCARHDQTSTVTCWGLEHLSGVSATPPTSLGAVLTIEVANDFACAVQASTNQVVCWGNNAPSTSALPTALDVAVGHDYICVIQLSNNRLKCEPLSTRPNFAYDGTEISLISAHNDTACLKLTGMESNKIGCTVSGGAINYFVFTDETTFDVATGNEFVCVTYNSSTQPTPEPTAPVCGVVGQCYINAQLTEQANKRTIGTNVQGSCDCEDLANAEINDIVVRQSYPAAADFAWEHNGNTNDCAVLYPQITGTDSFESACPFVDTSKTIYSSSGVPPPSAPPTPAPTPEHECADFTQYNWPPDSSLVQSGCRVSIHRHPPFEYVDWIAEDAVLYAIDNPDVAAAISSFNTELTFYYPNGDEPDGIHIVGACDDAHMGANNKLCHDWTRHDCTLRNGSYPRDCDCYCDALPRIIRPKPDCPDGSEGIVYQSATYRLPVVKPCVEWTRTDCTLRLSTKRGCPCVCGEPVPALDIKDEIYHWLTLVAISGAGLVVVLALSVLVYDVEQHFSSSRRDSD